MKRFIFIVLPLFILCILNVVLLVHYPYDVQAQSSTVYKRVTIAETPLYLTSNGTDLVCYLPYSYYVKILDDNGNFAHVELFGDDGLPAIDGYTPSYMLSVPESAVLSPYPNISLTTASACVLYADKYLTDSVQYLFSGRNLRFIGELSMPEKERVYLVGYNDKIGYVKESDVFPFTMPLHPDPLPNQESNDEVSNQPVSTTNNALKTGIFVCLILAGIIALLVAFRKKTPDVANAFYDENDYS